MSNGWIKLRNIRPDLISIRTAPGKDGRPRYHFKWDGGVWEITVVEAVRDDRADPPRSSLVDASDLP